MGSWNEVIIGMIERQEKENNSWFYKTWRKHFMNKTKALKHFNKIFCGENTIQLYRPNEERTFFFWNKHN